MTLAHVQDGDLELYLLGRLEPDRVYALESHVIDCSSCTNRVSAAAGFAFRLLTLSNRHLNNYEGTEKRREHRIPTDDPGHMQAFSPFSIAKFPVQITDISRNGLKVHTPEFTARGTIVQVVFRGAIILGEVRYCAPAGAEFDVGIQIQDVVPRQRK